jgi:hypothetical protein
MGFSGCECRSPIPKCVTHMRLSALYVGQHIATESSPEGARESNHMDGTPSEPSWRIDNGKR